MSDSLASYPGSLCRYRAQRERLPLCVTRAASTLADAKLAPYPESAINNVFVFGALMPSYEQDVVVVTKPV
jgi:hypothetical protein